MQLNLKSALNRIKALEHILSSFALNRYPEYVGSLVYSSQSKIAFLAGDCFFLKNKYSKSF